MNEKRKITDANSGYMEFNVCRPSVKSAKRGSGGITVLLRKQLSDYVCFVKSHENGIVWFKVIQQSYDQCDIYLCYIYIPPKDSSHVVWRAGTRTRVCCELLTVMHFSPGYV